MSNSLNQNACAIPAKLFEPKRKLSLIRVVTPQQSLLRIESWSARSRSLLLQPLRSLGEARREHELSRGAQRSATPADRARRDAGAFERDAGGGVGGGNLITAIYNMCS